MKITELLLAELNREAVGIRKTLEHVPEGKNDWKPHPKSMPLGALATILVLIRLISIPDTFAGTSGRAIGIWIALLSSLAVIVAGLLRAGNEL